MAPPTPRLIFRSSTSAPAFRAAAAVPSRDPSLTTRTSAQGTCSRTDWTTPPTDSSSFHAGMMTSRSCGAESSRARSGHTRPPFLEIVGYGDGARGDFPHGTVEYTRRLLASRPTGDGFPAPQNAKKEGPPVSRERRPWRRATFPSNRRSARPRCVRGRRARARNSAGAGRGA